MAFNQADIDELLAKTGRQCCLCRTLHRVQVHHIVPRNEGGTDDIENAIPLCPNCHDEVHKGHAPGRVSRIYTASELRMHRARTIELAHKAEVYRRDGDSWREDADLILFFAQALDRPAFRTRFHEELNFTDFDKAMEDTLLALNTGYWRMRDGTVIGRSRGRVHLVNPSWRTKLDTIVSCIEQVRLRFRKELGLETMLFRLGDLHEERQAMHREIFHTGFRGMSQAADSRFRSDKQLGSFMDHERQKAVDLMNEMLREIGHEPIPGVGGW